MRQKRPRRLLLLGTQRKRKVMPTRSCPSRPTHSNILCVPPLRPRVPQPNTALVLPLVLPLLPLT
jgi:hypothetical protein